MSDRPIIAPNVNKPVINATGVSGDVTSLVSVIQRVPGISYDIAWTGTLVGTLSVQVSNTVTLNPDGSIASAGNWNSLPPATFIGTYPIPAGSPGNGFLDVVGTEAYAVRIKFNYSSGTGNLIVYPCGKVL